ncbi:hypothetical protein CFC21_035350, partial [Triticum aestivum]
MLHPSSREPCLRPSPL